jgi:sarcosine oxidase delta subunit
MAKMSAEEFSSWQAYLHRNPRGLKWDNWVQANIHRAIMVAGRAGSAKNVPKLDAFLYKPPEPLIAKRLRAESKRRKSKK